MAHDSEHQAFLRAIIENPDDDNVRLVCADWFDEHGQPVRAHFIREQIKVFRSAGRDHPVPLNFTPDVFNLARQPFGGPPYRNWIAEAGCEVPGVEGVSFERGFIEAIRARADTFIDHGVTWVARAPVQSLALSACAPWVTALAYCAHLSRIESLTIRDPDFGGRSLNALLNSSHLGRLRALEITGAGDFRQMRLPGIGAAGVRSLARSPVAARLTELAIQTRGRIGAEPLRELLAALTGDRLQRLHLGGGAVNDDGAFALAEPGLLDGLRSLSVCSNEIGDAGALALVGSPVLRRAERLALTGNRISSVGLGALCRVELPPNLRWLGLSGNPLGRVDTRAILRLLRDRPALRINLMTCGIPGPQRRALLEAAPDQVLVGEVPRTRLTAKPG